MWTHVPLELIGSPEFMAEYLRRSQGLPLDIYLEADEQYGDQPVSRNLQAIVEVLITDVLIPTAPPCTKSGVLRAPPVRPGDI